MQGPLNVKQHVTSHVLLSWKYFWCWHEILYFGKYEIYFLEIRTSEDCWCGRQPATCYYNAPYHHFSHASSV